MAWAAGIIAGGIGVAGSMGAAKEGGKGIDKGIAAQNEALAQSRADLAPWKESGEGALLLLNQALGLEGYRTKEEIAYNKHLKAKPVDAATPFVKRGTLEKAADFMGPAAWLVDKQGDLLMESGAKSGPGGVGQGGAIGPLRDVVRAKTKRARKQAALSAATAAENAKKMAEWQSEADRLKGAMDQSLVGYDPAQNAKKLLATDPGYNFRMQEAERAIAARQAAGGMSQLTPGAARETTRYIGDMASDEWQRYLNNLRAQAGLGQTATNVGVGVTQNNAGATSNLLTAGGQMRGSAILNAAGALNQGIQGGLSNYYTMSMYDKLLNNQQPASSPVYNYSPGSYSMGNPDVAETYMYAE